ncbi:MAG: polyphosphate polymerase domain-containing protein [Clostridia bacterium]|nr:polyphosphate polymerase domain-containing protein [Clostridia bacterium]
MTEQKIFERYELKYLMTEAEYQKFMERIFHEICPDLYPTSSICNIYYDTPDYSLIRASLDHPVYKEKLRLRSYGVPMDDGKVFLEIKKKYEDVVYKRRETFSLSSAEEFLESPEPFSQITKEIAYFLSFYKSLQPAMALFYERTSFCGKDDPSLRITFDRKILYRDYDLDLKKGVYGASAIPAGTLLMEIKCAGALPLWLCRAISEQKINKTSFSKYGKAYSDLNFNNKGGCDNYEELVS